MLYQSGTTKEYASKMTRQRPDAAAEITGSGAYPDLHGTISFYTLKNGILVVSELFRLPTGDGPCGEKVFGFHIHEGTACSGNAQDPFADAGSHYNPENCPHPQHAGDLPPLFGNNGYAWSAVLTTRFSVKDIIGRTIILHSKPDDFTTQPSGNSGDKIACGVIYALPRPL